MIDDPGHPARMHVHVKAWHTDEALAIVDGVRVRVHRLVTGCRWACDEHGKFWHPNGCRHIAALAETTPTVSTYRGEPHHMPRLPGEATTEGEHA